jgi:hypothetical protein
VPARVGRAGTRRLAGVGFIAMGMAELAVPIWAEHASPTPWHPEHVITARSHQTLTNRGE